MEQKQQQSSDWLWSKDDEWKIITPKDFSNTQPQAAQTDLCLAPLWPDTHAQK